MCLVRQVELNPYWCALWSRITGCRQSPSSVHVPGRLQDPGEWYKALSYLRWCRSRQRDRFLPPILSLLISENSNQLIRDWGISISSTGGGGLPVVCSSPRCVKMADTTQGPTNGSFCQKKVSCLEQPVAQKCSYLMIPKWISVTNSILPSMNLFHHELFLQTPCLYKLRLCVSRWN